MLGVKHKLVNLNDLFSGWFNVSAGRDRKFLMIGVAAIFWALWKTRNKIMFSMCEPGDSTNIVLYVCHFLTCWAPLQKGALRRCCGRDPIDRQWWCRSCMDVAMAGILSA